MSLSGSDLTAIDLNLSRPGFDLSVAFTLPGHGVTVLFGPSGSGKTTILRCVAGLERAAGRVEIAGQIWQDSKSGRFVPTWKRPIGYVFQEASLFEHLDVLGNLEFGRRRSRHGGSRQALSEAIDLLGIGGLLRREPASLSGGERQRVAIARALATRPQVLLLDEPLAAIDQARRDEVLPWLERLQNQWRLPMLYVTHSAEEMMRLADHLLLLDQGRVAAQGAPAEVLYRCARTMSTGNLIGALLEGQIVALDPEFALCRVDLDGAELWLPDTGLAIGSPVRIHVGADQIILAKAENSLTGPGAETALVGTIIGLEDDPHPALAIVRVRCGRQGLTARVGRRRLMELGLGMDSKVLARLTGAVTLPGKLYPLGD